MRRLELGIALGDVLRALPLSDRRQILEQAGRVTGLGSLLGGSDTAIGMCMADGRRLLACNEAACALLGHTREELLRIDLAQLYVDPRQHKVLVGRARKYGCTLGLRVSVARGDGREVTVEMTVVALSEGNKKVLLLIAQLAQGRDWVYGTGVQGVKVIG